MGILHPLQGCESGTYKIETHSFQMKTDQKIYQRRWAWIAGFVIICGLLFSWQPAGAVQPKHYTDLAFPPLPELQLPDYTHFELDNGMQVYLMEDHELPLVAGQALFHTGARLEPSNKTGLASLTGTVMRSGGTRQHPADELNQRLEQKAAAVESEISNTSGTVGFNSLSEDLTAVVGLFAEVIREPAFAADQLDLAKQQLRGSIARRNDDPSSISSREFRKLVYGATSPYSRTVEYATLDQIERSDLTSFYRQYFRPDNMILGISGDFDTANLKALIEQEFGDWQVTEPLKIAPLPPVTQAETRGLFFVEQSQLNQSYIQMGHLGGQLNDPDFAALDVLNSVLNGFGGRLFNQVRSREGLAYSVYGVWSPRYDYPGLFVAGGQTRSEATVPLIQALKTQINKVRTEPISPEELRYAQESTINSFIFNFEDPQQTLSRLLGYEYYDYPQDFIFQYLQGVKATTIEDVLRVAQQYLRPENLVTLVVGNQVAIEPPLTSLGENLRIENLDITIPSN